MKPSPLLRQFPPQWLWVPGVTNDAVLRRGDISLLHAAAEKREDRPRKWRDSEEEVLDCCKLQSENLLFDESCQKISIQPTHTLGQFKNPAQFSAFACLNISHIGPKLKSLSISLSHNWGNKKSRTFNVWQSVRFLNHQPLIIFKEQININLWCVSRSSSAVSKTGFLERCPSLLRQHRRHLNLD